MGRMQAIKRFFLFLLGGMLVGATVASFVGPPLVKLTHAPAAESTAMCNCNTLADNMIGALFKAQLIGLLTGAILGAIVFVMIKRRNRLKKAT
jgi:ABC-type branched-subunit amino acid transport system permease subunit